MRLNIGSTGPNKPLVGRVLCLKRLLTFPARGFKISVYGTLKVLCTVLLDIPLSCCGRIR